MVFTPRRGFIERKVVDQLRINKLTVTWSFGRFCWLNQSELWYNNSKAPVSALLAAQCYPSYKDRYLITLFERWIAMTTAVSCKNYNKILYFWPKWSKSEMTLLGTKTTEVPAYPWYKVKRYVRPRMAFEAACIYLAYITEVCSSVTIWCAVQDGSNFFC